MNLLEYEAKQLISKYQVPIPSSVRITAVPADIPLPAVIKSQVPTGGRGKLGGVQIVDNTKDIEPIIRDLFAKPIRGYRPTTLLAEEKLEIARELYVSLLINREQAIIELVAHTDGGIDIEEHEANSFLRREITPHVVESVGEQLAEYYKLESQTFALQDLVENLYNCFVKSDATLIEINPLVLTEDGRLVAGDCKMTLDDAAAFRHPEWDFEHMHSDSNFVVLDKTGQIATIANGAGLAMATVDAVADASMTPANFLDIGGGASAESVLAAFRRIMEFSHVQGIVINIFAGITRCDEVAKAIITAKSQLDDLPPLFIRLAGTNYEAAETLLTEHAITLLSTLEDCLGAAKETTA